MKYEFMVIYTVHDPDDTQKYLNQLGLEGWHPVIWYTPEGSYSSQMVMQREINT